MCPSPKNGSANKMDFIGSSLLGLAQNAVGVFLSQSFRAEKPEELPEAFLPLLQRRKRIERNCIALEQERYSTPGGPKKKTTGRQEERSRFK
jgi:hypothetical protein